VSSFSAAFRDFPPSAEQAVTTPLVVAGIPELGIPDLPVYVASELAAMLEEDGTLRRGMPVLIAELMPVEPLAGVGGTFKNKGFW
jgi:hypothetical protein